jgi:hypothetical protein
MKQFERGLRYNEDNASHMVVGELYTPPPFGAIDIYNTNHSHASYVWKRFEDNEVVLYLGTFMALKHLGNDLDFLVFLTQDGVEVALLNLEAHYVKRLDKSHAI